ncbi:flavodoxin family protein [Chloroflexota bacterium]
MKALAIVGSQRKNGNTEIVARHTLKAIEEEGLKTELISLSGLDIKGCNDCEVCKKEERCSINDDLWPIYIKMKEADAIILASPVYFGSATPELKALMDRVGCVAYWNNGIFEGKVGGPLVVAERSGQQFTIAQINFWFHILGFFIPGSKIYWNLAFGLKKGDVETDEWGLRSMRDFGKNVAFLVKKLKA